MSARNFKDINWQLPTSAKGNLETWDMVRLAVLMDIRDEMKKLNTLLHCGNFIAIPHKLDEIRINTKKQKRPRKPA